MDATSTVRSAVIQRDLDAICARPLPWEQLAGSTVLVTGTSGMIPSYVTYGLLALNDTRNAGLTVLGLVRNGDKARRLLADIVDRPDFHLIEQDVTEPLDPPDRLDLVVHGASAARPALHAVNPVGTIKANLQGTFNLLDLCVATGCPRFVLMSSAEVYGRQPAGTELIGEDGYGSVDILNPRSCYSEGKRAAETIVASYVAQHSIRGTIARFGHIYGPGMALDDGRVQADFAADVMAGRDIVLNSDGSAMRTYTYVADAVAGMWYAILRGDELAYNIADPHGMVSIRELAEAFAGARADKHLNAVTRQSSDGRSYNPVKGQALDSARVAALGWQAEVDLPAGIDRTISWHEERAGATT